MFRLLSVFVALLLCAQTFAANKPVYQIICETNEKGQKPKSSSLIIEENNPGILKSKTIGVGEISFKVKVSSAQDGNLLVDYKYKNTEGKKNFELAEIAVPFTSGKSEIKNLHSSNGDELQLIITVIKE